MSSESLLKVYDSLDVLGSVIAPELSLQDLYTRALLLLIDAIARQKSWLVCEIDFIHILMLLLWIKELEGRNMRTATAHSLIGQHVSMVLVMILWMIPLLERLIGRWPVDLTLVSLSKSICGGILLVVKQPFLIDLLLLNAMNAWELELWDRSWRAYEYFITAHWRLPNGFRLLQVYAATVAPANAASWLLMRSKALLRRAYR